jgi:tetratricopeptide (TPR) repeat protein
MAKKKSSRKTVKHVPSRRLLDGLAAVDELMRSKQWEEAAARLESLQQAYSRDPQVLGRLVNVSYELGDTYAYQAAAERLLAIDPNELDLWPALAAAYIQHGLLALAARALREFLRRAPQHAKASDARVLLAEVEKDLEQARVTLDLPVTQSQALLELHDEVQSALSRGDYAHTRQLAEKLLRLKPDFAPALNNLTLAHVATGDLAQAQATVERVLAFQPDNVHALSNRVRLLAILGRFDEARAALPPLLASSAPATDRWLKRAEALSFLGMDQAVLDVFAEAQSLADTSAGAHSGMLSHLAAVAAARLGQTDVAQRHWKQALKLEPALTIARDNLDDLRLPVGERNGPWAFDLSNWITAAVLQDLHNDLRRFVQRNDAAIGAGARRFLDRHLYLIELIGVWLERGSPEARELALLLAKAAHTPALLAAVHAFALGQTGSDHQRRLAAQIAVEHGALPGGRVRLWTKGEWRDVLLLGIEINDAPVSGTSHSRQAEKLMLEAVELIQSGALAGLPKAEQLLKQVLAEEPDARDALNNLASIYFNTGRQPQAEAVWQRLFDRYPDYVFARVALARLAVQRGDLEAARTLLAPALQRPQLHFSEFSAIAGVQIDLALAAHETQAAEQWLELWTEVDPEDPRLDHFESEIRRRTRRPFGRP